ncbi:hypothetical protein OVY48_00950 [Sphingobium sp. SA2]|uniref:hypothetical protein n=1 Tax=Sphingobium sp. SA2 TaxID=1524832 RepID=UPI0028BFA01C|nr:hypothetical protein [Sphingobium sp. SA2]MDT7532023.1 hypothetical protein [Sphingobium sp. SA2]
MEMGRAESYGDYATLFTEINNAGRCFAVLAPSLVEQLKAMRSADNSVSLMTQLGISYNTWRKVQAGHPVRRSIAARIAAQLGELR